MHVQLCGCVKQQYLYSPDRMRRADSLRSRKAEADDNMMFAIDDIDCARM